MAFWPTYNQIAQQKKRMFMMQRVLPITIFAVGSSALAFHTTVLHPFHEELDH